MNKMLEKLMEKKKKEGSEMEPMYKDSKMSMLKALRDEMSGLMKGELAGDKMHEVQVASDSPEGLKEGLEKAEDVVEGVEAAMPESEEKEEDASLSDEEMALLEKLLAKAKAQK